mmetsp:Transcript_945/g.2706  ORF Transcript_945/g.2706 Transcript_945/m.2706 type:complete len:200 (+) Transcript_945:377-976(+)
MQAACPERNACCGASGSHAGSGASPRATSPNATSSADHTATRRACRTLPSLQRRVSGARRAACVCATWPTPNRCAGREKRVGDSATAVAQRPSASSPRCTARTARSSPAGAAAAAGVGNSDAARRSSPSDARTASSTWRAGSMRGSSACAAGWRIGAASTPANERPVKTGAPSAPGKQAASSRAMPPPMPRGAMTLQRM